MQSSTPPSGVFINPICAPPLNPATTAATLFFTDHYMVMGLDRWATTEEIKAAHRTLRAEYFRTDASKYAALQAAYAVLVNWEARRDYDAMSRLRLGLPGVPSPPMVGDRARVCPPSVIRICKDVRGMVATIEDGLVSPTPSSPFDEVPVDEIGDDVVGDAVGERVEQATEQMQEVAIVEQRTQDRNWALKHYNPIYKPTLGERPYPSFMPILKAYEGRKAHRKLKCAQPRYLGGPAGKARPI